MPPPAKGTLLPFPPESHIPEQHSPFTIPTSLSGLHAALEKPLSAAPLITNPPKYPSDTESAHPFLGGESAAHERLNHTIQSGSMTAYKATRNGLLGTDFSSKLSAWLALGCLTARQIHASLLAFEDGTSSASPEWKDTPGYGEGENEGTQAMRFELLWRDFMRLCSRKHGSKLFALGGFIDVPEGRWSERYSSKEGVAQDIPYPVIIERFLNGTTGMGFIDAAQREMFHTGYTSNRARQNVASFLAKKLNIDWRIGAEWYESMLVDYDTASNWGNWQYLAGVGNDPRGEARIFNPVKQAFDYDPNGDYVKAWVQELRSENLDVKEIFQAWTIPPNKRQETGIVGVEMAERPIVRIEFTVGRRGGKTSNGSSRHNKTTKYGNGHSSHSSTTGSSNGYSPRAYQDGSNFRGGYQHQQRGGRYGGRGYGSTRGYVQGRNGHGWGQGYGGQQMMHGGGREARSGMMDKDREIHNQNHQEGMEMGGT